MARGRKKPAEPMEEGSPAWMNTYGDMVTLLLTFFVLLFSFSTIDAQKWEQIVSSLSGTPYVAIQSLDLSNVSSANLDTSTWETPQPSPLPTTSEMSQVIDDAKYNEIMSRFNELYVKLKNHIETYGLQEMFDLQYVDEYTILIRMSDSAFFISGSADLKDEVKEQLDEMSGILEGYSDLIKTIRVEGHTDNVPIHSARFDDNWDLSLSRAVNVVRYILGVSTLDPSIFNPSGFGEFRPIADNRSDEGKAKNRRVDFVIENILKK